MPSCKRIAPYCQALFLIACAPLLGQAPAPARPAPPTIDLPDLGPSALPFDLRQIIEGKTAADYPTDAWCPSGEDFNSYLETRRRPELGEGWITPRGPGDPPVFWYDSGIVVIEDHGSLMRNDRPIDLPLETLEFTPSGSGYSAAWQPLVWEPDIGTQILTNQQTWMGAWLDFAAFTFPFGGQARTGVWVSPAMVLWFEQPSPPVTDYLCTRGCFYDQSEVLLERTPRVAPLQQGTSLYGWNLFFHEAADRVVFTWQATDGGALDLNVQTVLFSDGRIRFSYASLAGVPHGAPTVVTGNDAWWSNLTPTGSVTDPAGTVTIPAPDGPAMDLLGVSTFQVSGSEVLRVELELANPLPPTTTDRIYYYFQIRDEAGDETVLRAIYFRWDNGAWTYQAQGAEMVGNTLRFHLNLLELPIADNDIHFSVSTFRGSGTYEYGDIVEFEATFATPPRPVMFDLSDEAPFTEPDRPIFETFLLPELLPYSVGQAFAEHLPELEIDGLAIYQNFDTDIVFYAGGYSTAGNAGADGIGRGSSQDPITPAILHVNSVYRYYWLDWAMTVLTHEYAHRWLYFIQIMEGGVPTWSIDPGKSHPAAYVHMPAVQPVYRPFDFSCMGGSDWTDNGDGTFTSMAEDQGSRQGFTWDELYLMGLAAPWEVPDWWYIRDTDPPMPIAYWPPYDQTVTGVRVPVGLDQVIEAMGPRYPAYPDSKRDFIVPTVLLIRPGAVIQEEIDVVRALCDYWSPVWAQATDWRSTMRCLLTPPEVTITNPAAPQLITPGTSISFIGTGTDADGDEVEISWDFDGMAPPSDQPGPHLVMFPEEGVFTITLNGRDSTGMEAEPARLQVVVDCDFDIPPFEVEQLRVAREGDDLLRFTWWDLSTGPSDYILLRSEEAAGPFLPTGSETTGFPGLLHTERQGGLIFYELAPWYDPDCMGPY